MRRVLQGIVEAIKESNQLGRKGQYLCLDVCYCTVLRVWVKYIDPVPLVVV